MDTLDRDALVVKYLPLVRKITKAFYRRGGPSFDDLFQVGCIGLVHAGQYWDPERAASFITYAYTCVRQEIIKHLGAITCLRRTPPGRLLSLDEKLAQRCGAKLDDDETERLDQLAEARRMLRHTEEQAIHLRYDLGLSNREASERMGISRQRVSQLELRALERMRRRLIEAGAGEA